MWYKEDKIKIKNKDINVLAFIDVDYDGYTGIKIKSRYEGYNLEYFIKIDDENIALDLVSKFPKSTLKEILLLEINRLDLDAD